jgi:hypothetical protein
MGGKSFERGGSDAASLLALDHMSHIAIVELPLLERS